MTLSYNETIELIDVILKSSRENARTILFEILNSRGRKETEFYAGIIEHKKGLNLTTDQWFELLCLFPKRLLYLELEIENLLSQEQLRKLPRTTG